MTPADALAVSANTPASLAVTLNIPASIAPGPYNVTLTVADASGQPSHSLQLPIRVVQDFSVTSATLSQTLAAGPTTTGPYQLTVAPNPTGSSFTGLVTLSCSSGLPAGTHCIFAPSTPLTLGNSSAAVVMSISTTVADKVAVEWPSSHLSIFYAGSLMLPGIVIGCSLFGARSPKRRVKLLGIPMLLLSMLSLLSCGGVSSGANTTPPPGNKPVTYQITVTGTSAGTSPDADRVPS